MNVEAVESVSVHESEAYVIGACFWHQDAISEVVDLLKPEHFHDQRNANAWKAMLAIYSRGETIDVATVVVTLKAMHLLGGEAMGTVAYRLSRMESASCGKRNLLFHGLLIAQAWMNREAVMIGAEAMAMGADHNEDGFDIAERITRRVEEAMGEMAPRRSEKYARLEEEELRRMDAPKKEMHSTGFATLDKAIGGYHRGDLVIVAARPGMGKSSFATSSVIRSSQMKHPTGLFSLELNAPKMQARLFSRLSGVPLARIVRDELTAEQIAKRHESLSEAAKLPLWIRYDTGITVDAIRAEATRMVRQHKIGCIVIDQLNWIKPVKSGNRDAEVGSITRGLKQLAMQLDIGVVLLHQLSRAVETRGGDKRPILSDLRDSGNVEQDAQVVLFLHRPEYYGITEDQFGSTFGLVNVIIAKNSNGNCETLRMRFVPETASVHDDMHNEPTRTDDAPF